MTRRALRLAALLAVPPVVWAAQGLLGWWLTSRGCQAMEPPLTVVRWSMLIVSMAALASTVYGVVNGVSFVRAQHAAPAEDQDRRKFFGVVTLVIGVTLSLGVLLASLPMMLLTRCGGAS